MKPNKRSTWENPPIDGIPYAIYAPKFPILDGMQMDTSSRFGGTLTNPFFSSYVATGVTPSPLRSLAFTTIERMHVASVESLIDPWNHMASVFYPKNIPLNAPMSGNVTQEK